MLNIDGFGDNIGGFRRIKGGMNRYQRIKRDISGLREIKSI